MRAELLEKTNVIKKHMKSKKALSSIINYVIEEQRLACLFIGIAISAAAFTVVSSVSSSGRTISSDSVSVVSSIPRRITYELVDHDRSNHNVINAGGKVPLGLKRKNVRVLVTGGAGFVGSHLVDRLLERGDSVIVVDNFFTGRKENLLHHLNNPKFELVRHDVVEPILLEVDRIYHLACPASPVHYNTSEVYGDPLQHPQVETYWGNVNPIGVRSCYDEGKRTAETLAMDYHRGLNVEVRIARIFNTYGPRMCIDDGRVVSNFVAQALRKQPLTVYGDGKQTRSFQYVSDLVEGLMRLMEGNHVGPFNLGNPGEFTMLELAKVLLTQSQQIVALQNCTVTVEEKQNSINAARRTIFVLMSLS
ncbi:UDP-glucuronic acid decarboxylase 1 [Datura stramonium]|uniref:UDP-glucuronate decarboxylase n=1 Tax=Datura stramonium TaxID=4076 RepID=A0ABS8WM47_DATST|nr:UDP-glucuronic acid decarboxylase 1 [Datura stramonium]